jgi:formate dehydrogenase subunit gamma
VGQDPYQQTGPGLERQTPSDRPLRPEDVQLYVPYEDQIIGRVSIPDAKPATLVQPEGRLWHAFRMTGLIWATSIVILLTLAGFAAFYLLRGTIRLERGRSGRFVPRFNGLERFTHWVTALSFLALALRGLHGARRRLQNTFTMSRACRSCSASS